jgi:hypothetical protein
MVSYKYLNNILKNFNTVKEVLEKSTPLPKPGDDIWVWESADEAASHKVTRLIITDNSIEVEFNRYKLTEEGVKYAEDNNLYYNPASFNSLKDLLEDFPKKYVEPYKCDLTKVSYCNRERLGWFTYDEAFNTLKTYIEHIIIKNKQVCTPK